MKDFFYKRNDIIIALLILAAAAFVIYDRVDAIMNYEPQSAVEQTAEAVDDGDATANAEEVAADNASDEDTTEYIEIKIGKNSTLSDVATTLKAKGLIDSTDDFIKYMEDKGKASAIITDTYQIPKGASQEQIMKIITK